MALLEPIFNKSSKINDVHLFKGRPELRLYDQYKRFRIRIKEVELHLLDKLTDLENSRSALCSQLFLNPDYKRCFFEGSTLNFNKILSFTDIKIHKDFDFKAWVRAESPRLSIQLGVEFIEYSKDRFFEIIVLNIRILRLKKQLIKLKKKVISFDVYKDIIKIYNKGLINLLLEKRYVFSIGHGLARIKVVKQKIVPRKLLDGTYAFPMHFPETEKRRKELLAKGAVPYHRELFPDGQHYYVYITEGYCLWFHWYKGSCFLPNRKGFKFTIVDGQSAINLNYLNKRYNLKTVSSKDLQPKVRLWWLKKFRPKHVEKFPTYCYQDLVLEENILLRGYTTHVNPNDIPLVTNVKNNSFFENGAMGVLKEIREKRKKEQENCVKQTELV